jgi:Type IV secretion-system coupling protein DNA-binding domain
MNVSYLNTIAALATTHPLYLLTGGLAVAGTLAFVLLRLRVYFSHEALQLRALIGHGVLYRLLRVQVLVAVGMLAIGLLYSYVTLPVVVPVRIGPVITALIRSLGIIFNEWATVIIGLIIIVTVAFLSFEVLDWRTRKTTPCAAIRPPHLPIGDVPFPWSRWIGHLLLAGTTRAGKSVLLRAIIHMLRLHNIPALILDNSGDFLSKFYNPATDIILSPLDKRGAEGSFFCNLNRPQEIERLAHDLVGDGGDRSSRYFNNKCRELFIAICEWLWARGSLTNCQFCMVMLNQDVLKKMMVGSEWEAIIRDAKSWGDVYSTFISYFTIFRKFPPNAGLTKITLSKDGEAWEIIRQGVNLCDCARRMACGSWEMVFVPYKDGDTKTLGPFLSMIVSTFSTAVMDQGEDPNRRIGVIVDEVGEMPEISSLQSALSKGGKYGLSMMLGLQNVSQLKKIYGPDSATIILGNCSSQVILRLPDVDSAEWAADAIGKCYKIVSRSGENKKEELRHRILPNDIQHLPNLVAILIYFGLGLTKRIHLKYVKYPEIHPRHVDPSASAWRPIGAPAMQIPQHTPPASVVVDPIITLGGLAEESNNTCDENAESARRNE